MDISPGDSTPTSEVSYSAPHSATEQNSIGPVLLANALPRLISHPIQHIPSTPTSTCRPESSPLANPQSTPSMVPAPSCVTTSNAPGPPGLPRIMSQSTPTDSVEAKTLHSALLMTRQSSGECAAVQQPLTVDTNHTGQVIEGPPTPTHSEIPECAKGKIID